MKIVFHKTKFPLAPGGNIYHWKKADTDFEVAKNGKYLIGIIASAKNATQNNSTDDDDLRLVLDGYEFGKYEVYEEKISWKGLGTAASWDGASLKGGTKIIYFFVELKRGEHTLKFYADKTPALKEIKIWQMRKGELFKIKNVKPDENINTDKKGAPWLSFVFFGVKPKDFKISSICEAAAKNKTDGDNVKAVVNGGIIQSEKAPTSRKYKNFYFSGDLDKGEKEELGLSPNKFLDVENSVELWYDQSPRVWVSFKLFDGDNSFLEDLEDFNDKKESIKSTLRFVIWASKIFKPKMENTRRFLAHSIQDNPTDLNLDNSDRIVKKIKADNAYNKIKEIVIQEIRKGSMEAEVNVEGVVVFETGDLFAALHGLKTLSFVAKKITEKELDVEMVLFDVYDFEYQSYLDAFTDNSPYEVENMAEDLLFTCLNNLADKGEDYDAVKNFDIRITIKDLITIY
ncbi:MAG: hypothetical protein ABID64_00130 [Nitrospirota bacterium]|nr:hypothetical protein [Patescibacteria group bacterium]